MIKAARHFGMLSAGMTGWIHLRPMIHLSGKTAWPEQKDPPTSF
jgi:hypothetical protein